MTLHQHLPAVLLSFALIVTAWRAQAEEPAPTQTWTQWRGPQRDAQYHGESWPASLSEEHLRPAWRVPLGPSYSGPIVADDRVFVTETRDQKYEVVRALDRATGHELWSTQWEGSLKVPFFAASNGSWIRATPAFDGTRLYVAGMRDLLVCLDGATGERIWEVDFVQSLGAPLPDFGFASSPLLHGDHLYVQAGAGFVKVEKQSGKVLWRTLQDAGGMWGSAFASPTLAVLDSTTQLLVQTRSELAGVELETGTVLWKQEVPAFRGMNILTPTAIGNSIFTSSYGGRTFLFTPSRPGESVEAGGIWQVNETWTHKAQGYMSTPVVIDHHIYLHLKNQRFMCLDARTGEEKWTTKPFGKYWSMIANGNHILALDQRGELLLIKANPEKFELLDSRKVADDSWAHLVVCGNEVFVRELNALATFAWK